MTQEGCARAEQVSHIVGLGVRAGDALVEGARRGARVSCQLYLAPPKTPFWGPLPERHGRHTHRAGCVTPVALQGGEPAGGNETCAGAGDVLGSRLQLCGQANNDRSAPRRACSHAVVQTCVRASKRCSYAPGSSSAARVSTLRRRRTQLARRGGAANAVAGLCWHCRLGVQATCTGAGARNALIGGPAREKATLARTEPPDPRGAAVRTPQTACHVVHRRAGLPVAGQGAGDSRGAALAALLPPFPPPRAHRGWRHQQRRRSRGGFHPAAQPGGQREAGRGQQL